MKNTFWELAARLQVKDPPQTCKILTVVVGICILVHGAVIPLVLMCQFNIFRSLPLKNGESLRFSALKACQFNIIYSPLPKNGES